LYSKNTINLKLLMDDSTKITSKKYKTIGDLKKAQHKSIIHTVIQLKPSIEKDYLCKWLFETHYNKKFIGNLTNK